MSLKIQPEGLLRAVWKVDTSVAEQGDRSEPKWAAWIKRHAGWGPGKPMAKLRTQGKVGYSHPLKVQWLWAVAQKENKTMQSCMGCRLFIITAVYRTSGGSQDFHVKVNKEDRTGLHVALRHLDWTLTFTVGLDTDLHCWTWHWGLQIRETGSTLNSIKTF
jgi:hypothetical protein